MDLAQAGAGGEIPGRNAAFQQGSSGNPYRVASSFSQDSASYMDKVGRGFTPESVLNSTVQSSNGMSPGDYSSRTLTNGAKLPTSNGSSSDTWNLDTKLRLDGKPLLSPL
jgi:hypothetical protein